MKRVRFVSLFIFGLLTTLFAAPDKAKLNAGGVLDFSQTDFLSNKIYTLDGNWRAGKPEAGLIVVTVEEFGDKCTLISTNSFPLKNTLISFLCD